MDEQQRRQKGDRLRFAVSMGLPTDYSESTTAAWRNVAKTAKEWGLYAASTYVGDIANSLRKMKRFHDEGSPKPDSMDFPAWARSTMVDVALELCEPVPADIAKERAVRVIENALRLAFKEGGRQAKKGGE